jgi:uncharacterized LabA/DUF88 family protein
VRFPRATRPLEDSYEYMKAQRNDMAVLLAGDRDYVPNVASLQRKNLPVIVVFWHHATAKALREVAHDFHALDPHLDFLAR